MSEAEHNFQAAVNEGSDQLEKLDDLLEKLVDESKYLGTTTDFNRKFGQDLRVCSQYLQMLHQTSEKLHYYASHEPNNMPMISGAKEFDNMVRRASNVVTDYNVKLRKAQDDTTQRMANDAQRNYEAKSKEDYDKKFAGMSREEIRAYLDKKSNDRKGVKGFLGHFFGKGGMILPSQGGASIAPEGANELEREAYALMDKADEVHKEFRYTKNLYDPSGTTEGDNNVVKKLYKIGEDAFNVGEGFNNLIKKGFTKTADNQLARRIKHATTELNQIINEVMAIAAKYDDDDE